MKKIVAVVVFFSFCCTANFAQNEFRFGFQASPSFTWMTTNDNQINGNGSNLGLKLGVMGENYFQDNYALIFGLGFGFNYGGTLNHSQGGNYWPQSDLSNDIYYTLLPETNLKYGIQYVEIPLGFKMRTQEYGYIRYFAELPVFTLGILTQAKGDISGPGVTTPTEDEDIKKDVNFLTLSWGLGAGLEYNIGENTSLIAGIGFQTSFVDVTKDKSAEKFVYDENSGEVIDREPEDSKGNVNAFTIKIGVMF